MSNLKNIENLAELKAAQRKAIQKLRNEIKDNEDRDKIIQDKALQLPELLEADIVHIYMSFGSEVSTNSLLQNLLRKSKKVVIPFIDNSKKNLAFSLIEEFNTSSFKKGVFGILEPSEHIRKLIPPQEIDLFFLPGLAFDITGSRLGYGGGYYDKTLSVIKSSIKSKYLIALAYECQILPMVWTSPQDQKIDMIITEKRIIRCKNN